ncbi:leucine-rich repeat and IQ domain-containing protein 1-like isoform X2 [Patiria miniata]|uniref:Leucine-rich repeat and IQ domain-containing protein 1 n=1 Tax=Patiria miniata TaxID=46514 RepID=A0A913ZET1_PATMI|nr:leucine-rich repeat and IQ domain-containing protein 1-like isoform X2 [Patiria miniata]
MNPEYEEDLIEAEIQQQLKLLTLSDDGITVNDDYELKDKLDEVEMVGMEYAELDDEDDNMPDSIQQYLNMVNKRSEGLQKDLEECDNLLLDTSTLQGGSDELYYQSTEMKELAFMLGEDPEELRDRVLTEVEKEERKESEHVRDHMTDHVTNPETDLTGEVKANTGRSPEQHQTVHTTGDGIITRAADSEQKAWQDLLKLDGKLKQQQLDMQQDTQHEIMLQASRDQVKDQTRSAKLKQHADELKQMQQNRKVVEAKAAQELELQSKKNQEVLNKHQADIEKFAKETEAERLEFECHLAADRELKQKERLHAATLIQAAVRSYRVRKKYISRLNRLREERHQRQLQNRQMEIVAVRRAEEQRKKREREERKKKEEEERRRKEEIQTQEIEARQRQERLQKERIEQDRKQMEVLEKQKKEEEKQRRDQQLKQERELEERTQQILSKIKNEGSFPSGLTDEKLTENETMNDDAQEVFLTNRQEIQTTLEHQYPDYETVTNQHASNAAETPTLLISKDPSDTTMPVIAGTDMLLRNHETSSSEDRSPTPTLDLATSSGLTEKVKAVATCLQSATQTIPSETTDVNSDHNPVVLDSGIQGNSVQVVNDKIRSTEELYHQDSSTSPTLAADIEARRLQWMQNSASYRPVVSDLRSTETRRPLRRVPGANKLPALTSSQLLAASQSGTQLSQVTVVVIEKSTPCCLSSLVSCPDLTCLHLHRCGIMLLEALDHCSSITYIDLQHNKVEGIHCRDRTRLKQLMLQNNKLTSSYGLEGCTQLRYLQLSKNSITRTGGLESLVNLTHLDVSHNQLVSINGIGQLIHLTDLNVSHNHLSSVQDLQTCCLLQSLNIESNSLVEMPPVQNHVLLNDLRLTDNSISSIVPLCQAWLPLLQYVSIAQNGLSDLPDLKYCLMLRRFDISHNCITDMDIIVNGLRDCNHLEDVCLEGNPVTQDDQYRSAVLGSLRWLHVLDNEAIIKPISVPSPRTPLERMCLSQLYAQEQLHTTYQQHTASLTGNSPRDILQANQARDAYLESSLEQAIRHRCMHETGDMTEIQLVSSSSKQSTLYEQLSMQRKEERSTDPSDVMPSGGYDSKDDYTKITQCRHSPADDSVNTLPGRHVHVDYVTMAEGMPGYQHQSADGNLIPAHKESQTDDVITHERSSLNSGCYALEHSITSPPSSSQAVNKAKDSHPPQHPISHAATVIQARWRGYVVRRDLDIHTKQDLAALHIQTLWRGYRVRKMVAVARQAVRYRDSEDEEDAMLYDEIDPTSWDAAQANVDSDWLASETPCIPRSHPCVPATKKPWSSHQAVIQHDIPQPPRQAWYASPIPSTVYTNTDTQTSVPHLVSKPPIPPVHSSPASDTPRTTKSHRQDQISEEWGFKDAATAELMMKRAKKLSKGSSVHKNKTLNPLQRYQQMKKVHDSARVVPSPKRGVQRQEFFQAREQEIQKAMTAQRKEKEHKEARTFDWVHSHAEVHSDMMQECGRHSSSEPNLPAISPNALQGRVQLMASPLLELQSVDGASSVSSMSHRARSQSLSAQSHEELRLPAIKTNSAPSGRSRERPAVGGNRNQSRGWTSKR